jgi:hypothetical protein
MGFQLPSFGSGWCRGERGEVEEGCEVYWAVVGRRV